MFITSPWFSEYDDYIVENVDGWNDSNMRRAASVLIKRMIKGMKWWFIVQVLSLWIVFNLLPIIILNRYWYNLIFFHSILFPILLETNFFSKFILIFFSAYTIFSDLILSNLLYFIWFHFFRCRFSSELWLGILFSFKESEEDTV